MPTKPNDPLSPAAQQAREREWWTRFELFLVAVLAGVLVWMWFTLPEPVKGVLR